MTTRNLDALFEPKSIALIGASNRPGSVGAVLARNLLDSGFAGPVLPVNPHEAFIRSTLAYASVADLPLAPDLAVIATPPASVPGLIADLGERGCRAAVVITAGFGEAGGQGADLKMAMLEAARPHLLRIVGPNCLGVISPSRGVNASFAQLTPPAGGLALVAQSGAVTTAALDWASARGYGFSRVVTLGDMADVDFGDALDFLALDADTRAIVLYVEAVTQARKFMSAARIAGRNKPVVVIKAGRSAAGARAALSHTGALAGADAVYEAAFRRAGLLRVQELRELFDAVTTLTSGLKVRGDRLAIISNGGGAGVMAVDALEARGGRLAQLSAATIERLGKSLPAAWSKGDPVDVLGDAGPERYGEALEAVLEDRCADAVLVMNCPTAVTDSTAAARAVIEVAGRRNPRPAILTSWLGEAAPAQARKLFAAARIPTHETPDEAVRAFMHLAEHERNHRLLMQVPSAQDGPAPDRAGAQAILDKARGEGRALLTDPEAKTVLTAYGVPVARTLTAATPSEASKVADSLGGPVALKILSPDISHKSDVGGVVLGLSGGEVVAAAAEAMLANVARAAPAARIEGFMLQAMVERPHAEELIAGIALDPTFGPIVLFGSGGTSVEVVADRSIGLAPLNAHLALDMIGRTRVSKLLAGYRDRPPADLDAVADTLVRLSRMAVELDGLAELDINPLLADAGGVVAVDARIRVSAPGVAAPAPAIKPYPDDLVGELELAGGARLAVRPIRPEDAPGLMALVDRSSAEDVRLRFRSGLRRLPEEWAARLSQIDYDREMALCAVTPQGDILGVARLASDPEGVEAEFALMVRSDRQHQGLGHALLSRVVDFGQSRGLTRIYGEVERGNHRMLQVARDLGFRAGPSEDLSLVRVVKSLK
ncbi:MAG: bifunctional acetate--CoA ligase family protein/GNAT family N-acetyltransferase [Proteobacteria bacterium]|nr:bifunctional acetate--CoA ligase family protein/GNAT family N-acetyltransferase [Pseudomonadota bacterium]